MALAQQSRNKSEQAYDAITDMITFGELAPGAMLSESILMRLTGLGRTPVREALQRLGRDRIVEIHPSRGVFVAASSVEAQLKLLELRRTLECLAVRLASQRASSVQSEAMRQLARGLEASDKCDVRAFSLLLKQDHEIITASSNNDYLAVAMTPLQALSRRFWFAHLDDVEKELAAAAQLHAEILRAVSDGKETVATAASLKLNDYLTDFTYRTLPGR